MAGGTGGHIFPGIAVAQELRSRGVPVVWLGSVGGLETQLVPKAGLHLETLRIGGIRGKGWGALLTAPFRILAAVAGAWRLLGRHASAQRACRSAASRPALAASPPGCAACRLLVHEQNSIPGVTNRILSTFAKKRLCGFPGAFAGGEWLGNPVRAAIAALPAPEQRLSWSPGADASARARWQPGRTCAQSTRARGAGRLAERAASRSAPSMRREVCRRCARGVCRGRRRCARRAVYRRHGVGLCLGRSGRLPCRRIDPGRTCAAGVAAILVPFPSAVDDHQTRNAEAAVAVGAALLLPETQASAERIAALLSELLGDRARLLAMAQAARTLAKPDAAARIADACMQVAA